MDFADRVKQVAQRIEKLAPTIQTEEATKTAFIMPFISSLGYDVFNPAEVSPEYTADVGVKKGEKIDYAILKDGQPTIFIECKWCGGDLCAQHASQLFRYFATTTSTRIGILTNGIVYQFFADLVEKNKMDDKPFFVFDLRSYDDTSLKELQKFSKEAFDTETIISAASDLKYTGEIKRLLSELIGEPDDDFVRYFANRVYSGRLSKNILSEFSSIVKKAFSQFIRERINERLTAALNQEKTAPEETEEPPVEDDGIVTTQAEIDGYNIVRAICAQVVDVAKIYMRDTKSYCGILFDDNNRKPICRLRFNASTKYIGLIAPDKTETKETLEKLSDIYKYSDQIRTTAQSYAEESQ